ncbi:MAG: M23 family metallopeptidase [Bacteroidota bacterium]
MAQNLYKRIKEKLEKKYRVELIDDVTLYQTRQFVIKPVTILWVSALLLFSIVVGTAAFVIYTPTFHTLIPDYQNPDSVRIYGEEQRFVIDSLKAEVEKRDIFAANVLKIFGTDSAIMAAMGGRALPVVDNSRGRKAIEWEDPIKPVAENVISGNEAAEPKAAATEPSPPPIKQQSPQYYAPAEARPSPPVVRVSQKSPLLNLFAPVADGEMRNPYNEAKAHYGVDIVAEQNALILSVASGIVVISEYSDANGWVIGVSSAGNVLTFYKHNSRLLKQVGSPVFAGEPIAVIGNSGENSTGPHLHLEVWHNNAPVDPANYLDF